MSRNESYGYLLVGIVLLVGVAVSVEITHVVRTSEQDRVEQEFRDHATEQIFTLRTGIESRIDLVADIAAFYAASSFVDRTEFTVFSSIEARAAAGVQSLEWIPRVLPEELDQYEQLASRDGYDDFYIKEVGIDGSFVPVSDRTEYFPVFYVEPIEGNESAMGFDLASNPDRLKALEIARDTGKLTLTAPISLVQDAVERTEFLAFKPIYKNGTDVSNVAARQRNLVGFVLGEFRVNDLISNVLEPYSEDGAPRLATLQVVDVTNPDNVELLFESQTSSETVSQQILPLVSNTIELGEREWLVTARPSHPSVVAVTAWIPWEILASGIGISLLASAFLFTTIRRARTVTKLVGQRTSELSEANDQLVFQISERQKDEGKLRDSQARTKAIVDLAVDAIITIDERGLIETANRAAEKVFDYSSEQMIGQNVSMLMPSPYHEEHDQYLKNYTDTRERKIIGIGREVIGLRRDGSTFPMELSVSEVSLNDRTMFTGIVRDITERKAAEESLRQDQERLEKRVSERTEEVRSIARIGGLFSSGLDMRQIFDEFSLQFSKIVAHEKLTLYEYDSEHGGLIRVSSTDKNGHWPQQLRLPVAWNGIPSEKQEIARISKQAGHNGLIGDEKSDFALTESIAVPLLSNRELIGVLFVSRIGTEFDDDAIDKSRRVGFQIAGALATSLLYERNMVLAAERQRTLEDEQSRLKTADQAKNEFLSSLSHELRTPLVPILGYASMLVGKLSGKVDDDDLVKLRTIERNGERLKSQIEDLLEISRIQTRQLNIEPAWVEWRSFLADLDLSLKHLLDASGHRLVLNIRHDDIWVNVDSGRINQVVSNLISNAAKYSPGADTVEVTSELTSAGVHLSITDHGVGIEEADQKHLFTLFYRTQDAVSSATPGTGIGLFVAKKIVEMHGGELTIDSVWGEGSTARLTLTAEVNKPSMADRPVSKFQNRFENLSA